MGDPTEAEAGGGPGVAETDGLLERAAERGRIAAALEAARAGGGALLAIEGEAGIGKSRLLALARELAGDQFEVLWARGAELEQQLAYGVCTQLFERRLEAMSRGERERALAGAAVHAQAALGVGQGSESPNVELHGLYWLAANLAGQRPLLLLVDDLHWGDEPSLRWLHYVAGRLDGLPLLAVVAATVVDEIPGAELAAYHARAARLVADAERVGNCQPIRSLEAMSRSIGAREKQISVTSRWFRCTRVASSSSPRFEHPGQAPTS